MSKVGHTPGPWEVDEHEGLVYRPMPEQGANAADFVCSISTGKPEAEANARLIAAAPDLLEACEAVLKALLHDTKDDQARTVWLQPPFPAGAEHESAISHLMFVIMKATKPVSEPEAD